MGMLVELDHHLIDFAPAFEKPWLTSVFVVLSAWWVKGPLLIGLGLAADVLRGRRMPVAFLAAGSATLVTSVLVDVLKNFFDRARPPVNDPAPGRARGHSRQSVVPVGSRGHGLRRRHRPRGPVSQAAPLGPGLAAAVARRASTCACTSRSTCSPAG